MFCRSASCVSATSGCSLIGSVPNCCICAGRICRPTLPHPSAAWRELSVSTVIAASCGSLRNFPPRRFPPGSIHLSRTTLHDPSSSVPMVFPLPPRTGYPFQPTHKCAQTPPLYPSMPLLLPMTRFPGVLATTIDAPLLASPYCPSSFFSPSPTSRHPHSRFKTHNCGRGFAQPTLPQVLRPEAQSR